MQNYTAVVKYKYFLAIDCIMFVLVGGFIMFCLLRVCNLNFQHVTFSH